MSTTILAADNLCKRYGNQLVLDSVSLYIDKGDIYGFIGENGAGKTTFLRSIAGLIRTDSGEISLFANTNFKAELGRVSFVIDTPLYEKNTAKENMEIYCKLQGVDLKRISEVLSTVGLSNADPKKKVNGFSSGMKQKLRIAIALISEPEFLVLDEPENGLDHTSQQELIRLIRTLNQRGTTVLISSHILPGLEKHATRYGFIKDGKVIHQCKADEIEKSLSEFYCDLLGGSYEKFD